jgi:ABC-type uncharacterized transport system permease subunit
MEVVTTIMVSWGVFVISAIIVTRNFEKKETRLAMRTHRKHYG